MTAHFEHYVQLLRTAQEWAAVAKRALRAPLLGLAARGLDTAPGRCFVLASASILWIGIVAASEG